MPRIRFSADALEVEAADGDWLYDVCVDAKASIPFSCKAGACGTCATEVINGAGLGAPTARELRTLAASGLDPGKTRLPCLHSVEGDIVFGRPVSASGRATELPTRLAEVESLRRLNQTVCEVRFYAGPGFTFRPGQYVIFQIPSADGREVIRRSYSISTPPSDERHFEICVRAVPGGFGSNWVHRLRRGQQVRVEGPLGDFALQDGAREALFIATGTGISPIKSMLMHLLDQRSNRRARLFFGVRTTQDLFYTDFLRGLEAHYPAFESHTILSSPDPTQWSGRRGRVTDLIDGLLTPAEAAVTEAYLCGSQAMIADAVRRLEHKGLAREHIHHENFY